jgi:hypothetical protein
MASRRCCAVEKQHGKHLVPLGGQVQLQVVLDGLPGECEHLALAQLLGQRAARQLQHGHEFSALGRPQALDALQVGGAGVQQPGDAAKAARGLATGEVLCGGLQQLLRQLQHAFAHDAGAQQDGQQLRIGQRGGPARQELFARLRVGRKVFERHGDGGVNAET